MWQRWRLRFRIFLFFALIACAGALAIGGGLWLGFTRLEPDNPLPAFVIAGLVAVFAMTGLVIWIWLLFDENVAKPLENLSTDLRARTHTDLESSIDAEKARYLGDIGPAASAVADTLIEQRSALVEAVARETQAIAQQNARLEQVLRDMPDGVILCTAAHRIALYNARSGEIFAGSELLGLDRPIFDLLAEAPLRHAYARLQGQSDPGRAVDLLCTTAQGARMLAGRMRLLPAEHGEEAPAYMLALSDITRSLESSAAMNRRLRDRLHDLRRPAANLGAVVAALDLAEGTGAGALRQAISAEVETLGQVVSDLMADHDRLGRDWWPMSDIAVSDLTAAMVADGEIRPGARPDPSLVLRCDSFAIVAFLRGAADLLRQHGGQDLHFAVQAEPPGALLILSASGASLPVSAVETWLETALPGVETGFTAQDVLDRHGSECWPETRGAQTRLCLPLREAGHTDPAASPATRAEFYDFSLLDSDAPGAHDARTLADLSYVVFDTETTGLLPNQGDEIVQIAAMRIVKQRLLTGEAFDTLVNPGRSIPKLATSVHGISEEMVADAPEVPNAVKRFHAYCGDAVLIAHNAPFDIAFLRRQEAPLGISFDNPVLDTVLLSAILYGRTAEHSLDALTQRLGIEIPAEDRHTALGDARATGQAFLRMVPMLDEAGVGTLGQTIQEFRKHRSLLKSVT
ncbi:MAG: exonuclease domain-containing protein [Pseudomonadota bacterium]